MEITSKPEALDEMDRKVLQLEMERLSLQKVTVLFSGVVRVPQLGLSNHKVLQLDIVRASLQLRRSAVEQRFYMCLSGLRGAMCGLLLQASKLCRCNDSARSGQHVLQRMYIHTIQAHGRVVHVSDVNNCCCSALLNSRLPPATVLLRRVLLLWTASSAS
jgi:hypothetical protein